jgi:hypothetical protein
VQTIEHEIERLSQKELEQLQSWFLEFNSDSWDRQIEVDATAGKLDALAAEALEEYDAGKAREI